ncbi:nitroreductase family deazaflavin-dependent oxidoreductase [Spiractinospora alimapuensis]|nr:nitroreductase family deazaflavin-dependent oxidoreductase [Spiractinospora alimapuensis]QVQ54913.1 nitroreductase family deazaflavin-dependent oxidoreductase [Spiractinospora alimapuensis]
MLYGPEHVRRYRETNGAEGHHWVRGTTVLLLTTTGRKTGEKHTTPLIYREIDGRYVIVASNGGAENHPAWYLNIQADPAVVAQVGSEMFPALASTASDAERPMLWSEMTEVWPDYDDYQKTTDRIIPVVVLEPNT